MAECWIMFIWVLLLSLICKNSKSCYNMYYNPDNTLEYKANKQYSFFIFILPFLLIATRTEFIDTSGYLATFNHIPTEWSLFKNYVNSCGEAQLFYGIQMLFKLIFTSKAQWWIAFLAGIHSVFLLRTLRKYSVDFGLSVYIFVASAMVLSWMCNGLRQFVVVVILFSATDWILENKWLNYLLLVVLMMGIGPICSVMGWENRFWLLGGIHESVLIMIPVFFCVQGTALNKRLLVFVAIMVLLILSGGMEAFMAMIAEETVYGQDLEYVLSDTGTNIVRCLVSFVPVIMVLIKAKEIRSASVPPIIHLCVNMSVVSVVIYAASTVTSGIFVGRLPIYCEVYNLILIPWLINNPYRSSRKELLAGVYVLYGAYFFYQVGVAWKDSLYVCSFLNI